MELILVRHGLPQRIERDSGAADPELSDTGWQQAKAVGNWLSEHEKIDRVYASPMNRARQTAEPFAEHTGHSITLVEEVAEFDRKSRAYVPMEELKKENYAAWQKMAAGNYGSRVDHGGVINVWATHCLGLEPKLFTDVRYCSISRSMCASTGQRNLQSLNETQHLRSAL